MTREELIDAFLTGDLDEAGRAELDAALETDPHLVHEIADQQQLHRAIEVLMGDGTADQQVAVSVLGVIRGENLDAFKASILDRVRKDDREKRRKDESLRVTTNKVPRANPPTPANPIPVDEVRSAARPRRRRAWPWVAAAGIAACLAVAAGWPLFVRTAVEGTGNRSAWILSAEDTARVERGGRSFPARVDMALRPGDQVSGAVLIGFGGDITQVSLEEDAAVLFLEGGRSKRLEVERGTVEARVAPQEEPMALGTPISELRVREGRVRLESGDGFARADVFEGGAVLVRRSDEASTAVAAGQYAVAGREGEMIARAFEDAPSGGEPEAVAVLRRVKGEVHLFTTSPGERAEAKPGQGIGRDQGIVVEGKESLAVVEYPDQTLLEIGGDTVVRSLAGPEDAKHVQLESGRLLADVMKQPKGRPMRLRTPQAEVEVVGTRFVLSHGREESQVTVEEGAVRFTDVQAKRTVTVESGYFAIAAPGRPLEPVHHPSGVRYLDLDLAAGRTVGDGAWTVDGRTVRQEKINREAEPGGRQPFTSHVWPAGVEEGVLVEAEVKVSRVTPDTSGARAAWGFGLVAEFANRNVVLRTVQGGPGGSVFEFGGLARSIPFEHGREGTYRLKLRIERAEGRPAKVTGKIWQGEREPDGWVIDGELPLEGTLEQVGLQALRCRTAFTSFRVRVLPAEGP